MTGRSIAIFTPTYNRAHILQRCYESLVAQTSKDFTWLLVDDGSYDGTEELVKGWMASGLLNIQYIRQSNGGKHIAHNTAVDNCQEEYLLILDSDDYLDKKCVEILEDYIADIDGDNDVCGVIGGGGRHSQVLPNGVEYASGLELYQKYNYVGETMRLYKTRILKKFPFPSVPDEKFIYENVVFDQIDARYKMLVIHDRLYYGDYLEDGYTTNSGRLKCRNPVGYALSLDSSVKYSLLMSKKINWTILYIIWCKEMNVSRAFSRGSNKSLYLLLYPLAIVCILLEKPGFFFAILKERNRI